MDSSTGGTENASAQAISGSNNDHEPTTNQRSQRNATKTDSVAIHKSQTYDRSEATMERRIKEEGAPSHEREIVVARAVLTYLQTKNPTIFRKATAIATEDYHGWLQQHSSPRDMECLKAVIGEQYWSRAKRHLEEHLRRASDNKGHKAVTSFNPQSSAPGVSEEDTLHEVNGELYPVFGHILLRYLDSQNRALCKVAKDMIDDCMARSQRKEEGYESITASMRLQVKPAIGDFYWKQAETIYAHYQRQRKEVAVEASPPTSRLSPKSPQELQSTLEEPSADTNDYTMYDPTPVEKLRRLQPEEEPDMEGIDAALDFLCRS